MIEVGECLVVVFLLSQLDAAIVENPAVVRTEADGLRVVAQGLVDLIPILPEGGPHHEGKRVTRVGTNLVAEEFDPLVDRDDLIGESPTVQSIPFCLEPEPGTIDLFDPVEVNGPPALHDTVFDVEAEVVEPLHHPLSNPRPLSRWMGLDLCVSHLGPHQPQAQRNQPHRQAGCAPVVTVPAPDVSPDGFTLLNNVHALHFRSNVHRPTLLNQFDSFHTRFMDYTRQATCHPITTPGRRRRGVPTIITLGSGFRKVGCCGKSSSSSFESGSIRAVNPCSNDSCDE